MPGTKRDFYDVCPDCWSVRIKHRVFKDPRYKCEKCGSEFLNKKRISYDERIFFNEVLRLTRMKIGSMKFLVGDKTIRVITVKSVKEHFNHA